MNEFTVAQETGQDSIVTVRKEDTTDFMERPVSTLYFESDQYLDTDSGRSWEVNKAIEQYCIERGYQVARRPTGRNTTQAVYDARMHSSILTSKLEAQVKTAPMFVATVENARKRAASINQKYAPTIARLNHLVFLLGEAQEGELEKVRTALKTTAARVLGELDIPDEISEHDRRRRLFNPRWPLVKVERQRTHSKNLPDLEQVAALMNELKIAK